MKKIWETGIILFATMGFWGMIYPDLCFTQEVCEVVYEESAGGTEEMSDNDSGKAADMFTQICEAKPEQIRVRSALFHSLFREKPEEEKEEVYNCDGTEQSQKFFHREDMLTPKEMAGKVGIIESKGSSNDGDKGNRGIQ